MLPLLKKIGTDNQIFQHVKVNEPHFYPLWHHHPQCEIMIVEKSNGVRYVGDKIDNFIAGDVMLFGPDVPHIFRNHENYFKKGSRLKAKATVIYFNEHFAGEGFLKLNETSAIQKLLIIARQGILFRGEEAKIISRKIYKIIKLDGFKRLMSFVETLHFMATISEYTTLSSAGFSPVFDEKDTDRLNRIIDHLMKNFTKSIKLEEVATLSNMSTTAFCRYFKARSNKTLIEFLTEIRVGHACKLLIENNEMSISQVCFESGFNTLTNFDIQFKKRKGKSPGEYRDMYQKNLF